MDCRTVGKIDTRLEMASVSRKRDADAEWNLRDRIPPNTVALENVETWGSSHHVHSVGGFWGPLGFGQRLPMSAKKEKEREKKRSEDEGEIRLCTLARPNYNRRFTAV